MFFRELGELTTPARGLYITPSRLSSANAGKSAHRPMGTAALAWSLFVVCLRQLSRECYAKTIVILHKKQCFIKCVFRVYPICTLHITRYRDYFRKGTTYSVLSLQLRFFHLWKLQRRLVPLCDLLGCLMWYTVLLPGLYWGGLCHAIGGLSNKDQIRVGSCLIM